ncbi:MAG: hypothetical protein M5R36_14840 [Deltaproteobacteria bacterium]|nr:hypothetical protein [Deltaproteobacteria bacterium]
MAKQAPPVRFDWSGLLAGGVTEKQWRASKTQAAAAREIMDADAEAGRMDFMRLPSDRGRLKQSVDLARKMRSGVEDLIVCGIGGSALGLLALTNALLHPTHNMLPARMRKAPRVHVLDNADADSLAAVRHSVNLKKSLIVVISKSGGGGETIANFLVLFDRVVREHGGNMKKRSGRSWRSPTRKKVRSGILPTSTAWRRCPSLPMSAGVFPCSPRSEFFPRPCSAWMSAH